jgi:hypothetical protein
LKHWALRPGKCTDTRCFWPEILKIVLPWVQTKETKVSKTSVATLFSQHIRAKNRGLQHIFWGLQHIFLKSQHHNLLIIRLATLATHFFRYYTYEYVIRKKNTFYFFFLFFIFPTKRCCNMCCWCCWIDSQLVMLLQIFGFLL